MKKKLSLLLAVFFIAFTYSQGEANIWYFGNYAGLDFNNGNPVALTNGQVNTYEASAIMSNASGQLLFYTDGNTVWNRNHQIMLNGTGLLGHNSATQAAIIVPKPGSTSIYYIFTVTELAMSDGLRYSEVDMNLDSGLGGITSIKNVLLKTPVCEKLTAVKNTANDGYWVISHGYGNNNFFSYEITSLGMNPTPIISSIGAVVSGDVFRAVGQLKVSPDGTKLICSNNEINVELFDFNATTGVISNCRIINTDNYSYGVEFSQSGNIAYITSGDTSSVNLIQYDLTASNITSSALVLYYSGIFNRIGALQLAPDGKIYLANDLSNNINRINSPETLGFGCDFQLNNISTGFSACRLGLPQFIQSLFNASILAQSFCLGTPTSFSVVSSQPPVSVLWNFGDGVTSTATNPTHQYLNPGNYTVSVEVTTAIGTTNKNKQITISAIPVVANLVTNQSFCGTVNQNYNLSQFNATLLGSQSTSTYGVAYFSSMANATNHSYALPNIQSLPLGVTTFYAKVYNLSNTACNAITNFTVTFSQQPIANTVTDYIICENLPYDNIEQFDLSTKNTQILNGQIPSNFTITYHTTQSDANLDLSPLPSLYTNTLTQETIYARIENNANPACFDTVCFQIKVIQQPIISPVTDFILCDDSSNNGIETFDLSQKTLEIVNGQSQSVFQVKYFLNLADAQSDVNQINPPINNSTNNQIIYYSISAIGNSNCLSISSFKLIVLPFTLANTPNNIFVCDDVTNDGVAVFNLNSNVSAILGTQSASQVGISYHLSQNDANTNSNPLPLNFQNTSNPQTIFVRVENNQKQSCFATTSFQIGLYKMPIANQLQDMFLCDDQSNDGDEVFDLSQQNNTVLGTQSATDFNISYHLSSIEAISGLNPLTSIYNNSTNPQTIYVRIENKLSTSCFKTTSFQLFVKPRPVLTLNDTYSICEGNEITITAPIGFSSYTWSNGSAGNSTVIQQAGNYTVTVTEDYGDIICDTTKPFTVVNSNIATITQIITSDWTDTENTISVIVTGDGIYEYSIDGYNYQDSNIFIGLRFGEFIVYVRDKNGCGIKEQEIFLLMYPKFFTPNGDGFNDNWQIKLSTTEPNMDITIFDRYGKLITNFKGTSFGWDGIHNGKLVPSDDYWFVVKRQNGKEYKGHFTLKR
jgi:gliding motility-associated-like protein